jgi:serine kinase of HPr protein (carbohydrate metabolism regulator)
MDLRLLETLPELDIVCNNTRDAQIVAGYTSDLLSDVMANAEEDSVLITIQAHKNSIAVASIAGINAIVFCNGRTVDDEMIEAAEEAEIALFQTTQNQFDTTLLIGNFLKNGA